MLLNKLLFILAALSALAVFVHSATSAAYTAPNSIYSSAGIFDHIQERTPSILPHISAPPPPT
jgi:hypothetical protein